MKTGARIRGFLSSQAGFTLLELTVVATILGVMAGIVALAVSGQATTGRAAAKGADVAEVQKAVDNFAGQHPSGRFPTLNGCRPGEDLDLITRRCESDSADILDPTQVNTNNLEFAVLEFSVDLDLDRDGDTTGSVMVVPIIWDKAFTGEFGDVVVLAGDFIQREPKHAFEFLLPGNDANGIWLDSTNIDPDDLGNITSTSITAPSGLGTGENKIDTTASQIPVWVLNAEGNVFNLLPAPRY